MLCKCVTTFDAKILCITLCVCVACFRADIEVVQSDVSELETRLDKVRFMHLRTLFQSLLYFENIHTHTQVSVVVGFTLLI